MDIDVPSSNRRSASEVVINFATMRERWGIKDFVRACAQRGLSRVSMWGDEVDRYGLDASRDLLAETGLQVFGFNRAGPLAGASAARRRENLDAARHVLDQAMQLCADHVLVFSGGLAPGSRGLGDARAQFEDAVGALLEHARPMGLKLAIEPLHPMLAGDRAVVVSLSQANDICDRLGAGIGVVIDVYHVWWDERLSAEIARSGSAGRILGFHVNDWLVPTKHILRDRGMMGDGIIDLAGIWRQVRACGYGGPVEVEIFSDRWWAEDPHLVLDMSIARCGEIFSMNDARP